MENDRSLVTVQTKTIIEAHEACFYDHLKILRANKKLINQLINLDSAILKNVIATT